jgi:hypothetical protein
MEETLGIIDTLYTCLLQSDMNDASKQEAFSLVEMIRVHTVGAGHTISTLRDLAAKYKSMLDDVNE